MGASGIFASFRPRFPLKKRFVNEEQLPFPEGYAAGVVMDSIHDGNGGEGLLKARILGAGAGATSPSGRCGGGWR